VFWFGLGKLQVPTKTALSLPLLSWAGEKGNMMKGSRVETRTRRDHSPTTVTDKTELEEKREFNSSQSNQSRIVRNKARS